MLLIRVTVLYPVLPDASLLVLSAGSNHGIIALDASCESKWSDLNEPPSSKTFGFPLTFTVIQDLPKHIQTRQTGRQLQSREQNSTARPQHLRQNPPD